MRTGNMKRTVTMAMAGTNTSTNHTQATASPTITSPITTSHTQTTPNPTAATTSATTQVQAGYGRDTSRYRPKELKYKQSETDQAGYEHWELENNGDRLNKRKGLEYKGEVTDGAHEHRDLVYNDNKMHELKELK
jgi:hypothetical protein